MRRLTVFPTLLILAATACAHPPRVLPGGGVGYQSNPELGWHTKAIVSKREPETLFANDGTICRVSPDRFRDTAVGAVVRCNWQ
jgi:hypothetical protein